VPLCEYVLKKMKRAMDLLERDSPGTRKKVITFATPDVVCHPSRLAEIFPKLQGKTPLIDQRSKGIIGWHKAQSITDAIVDTRWFFDTLGYDITAVDIYEGRGYEVIYDLNGKLCQDFPSFYEQFDLVYDCVSNQIFHIAQCMTNAAEAVKVGGYILHIIPVAMVNQGFYAVSPTTYWDFYSQQYHNGNQTFLLCSFDQVDGVYQDKRWLKLSPWIRERGVPEDAMNLALAQKLQALNGQPVVCPVMTKFRNNQDCQRFDT
jgi:hypothetical protein